MPGTEKKRHLQRRAVLKMARSCCFDEPHARQVARIAGLLFDGLRALHKLKRGERFWLTCAALLHDIGWIAGRRKHHKKTLNLIANSVTLPLNYRRRMMVASIARYHRRALPSLKHRHFSALIPHDRKIVLILAALLRTADGFDSTHRQAVKHVACRITPNVIIIRYRADIPVPSEIRAAWDKSDLLQKVFKRKIRIQPD